MTFNKKILQISFIFAFLCLAFAQTAGAQQSDRPIAVPIENQSIVIKTPNGGESYDRGDLIKYSWTQKEKSKKLEVSIINASTSQSVYTVKKYDGSGLNKKSISKKVTSEIPAGLYKLKICDVAGVTPVCDSSDAYFTITSKIEDYEINDDPRSQTIVIESPNGGESYVEGDKIKYSWTQGQNSKKLEFSIIRESDGKVVFNNKDYNGRGLNKKTFSKKVSEEIGEGSYKLRICDVTQESSPVCDMSDSAFTVKAIGSIVVPTPIKPPVVNIKTPALKVINPNGGETYKVGESMGVKWKAENVQNVKENNVSIYLYQNDNQEQKIDLGRNSTDISIKKGKATVTIPRTLTPGSYKILVENDGIPLRDGSDKSFSITSTSTKKIRQGQTNDDAVENTGTVSRPERTGQTNDDAQENTRPTINPAVPPVPLPSPIIAPRTGQTNSDAQETKPKEKKPKSEPKKICYLVVKEKKNGKTVEKTKEVGCNSSEFKNAPKKQRIIMEVAGESVEVYVITQNLELGMVHGEVKTLQEYLNSNGYIVNDIEGEAGSQGYEADYFGQKTKEAVIRFQIDKGITPASGFVGPKTRQAMGI